MRLVVHAENGAELDKSLVFVQRAYTFFPTARALITTRSTIQIPNQDQSILAAPAAPAFIAFS